jgi:hypothetical protein
MSVGPQYTVQNAVNSLSDFSDYLRPFTNIDNFSYFYDPERETTRANAPNSPEIWRTHETMESGTHMSTAAQILANRANAALSTGPRTPHGKAASSRNATKHGLSSAFRVLAHEDQQEFDQLLEDLRACHRPRDIHQRLLVDQLAKSQWLLARAQRLQAVAYDLLAGVEDENDPDLAIVKAMRASHADIIGRLERYAASAERSFYKALRELAKQNEANLKQALERKWIERIANAPLPTHPRLQNSPRPAQTNPVAAHPSNPALRL